MLGPVELERLQAEVEALRRSLFEKATDAYASLHDTTTAVTQLRELKELDEHKAFLSPSYLQTLRASESIRTVEGRAREVTASYDNSDLVRLLKGTNELTEQLAKQETAGATDRETYENLRAVFIAGIKQALIRYYQQQVTEANAASDIERRKLAVGLAADRAREITAAVIELERKPTQAMAKFKDSSYGFLLTDPVLRFNASHERELVFSPTFETLPLTVLVALAKKIQKETGQHAAFSELHNTPVSSTKKFYDYFRCEYWMRKLTYRITPTEEGTAFLAKVDPFERGLVERTNEVRRLQASTASGIGAATTHLQRVVSPAIAACNQQISTTKAALLRIASDEAKESALQHATIQRAQRIVAERKAAFVEQSNRLATLIAEYEVLQADAKIIPEAENQRLVVKMAAVDVKFKQILEQQPHVNAAKKLVAKGVRALNELLGQVQEKYRGDAYQTALRAQAEVTAQVLAIDEENKLANDKVPGFILQRRALDVRLAESNRLAELQRLAEEREREREEKAQQALAGLEATYQRALTAFNLMNTTNESLKQIEIKVNEQSATEKLYLFSCK